MRHLIAVVCFMLAASPLAMAQDKKDSGKAAVAAEQSEKAETKAKAETKKSGKAKKEAKKREPSEKQKAQQERMRACSKEASDKGLKKDERAKFMKECMKKG